MKVDIHTYPPNEDVQVIVLTPHPKVFLVRFKWSACWLAKFCKETCWEAEVETFLLGKKEQTEIFQQLKICLLLRGHDSFRWILTN